MALAIVSSRPGWAFGCFLLAAGSDALDGPLARKRGEASLAGSFFDHGTDALFVASGFAALAQIGAPTAWLALLILLSFAEYAWDFVSRGGNLRANPLGRWNGLAYFALLGIWLATESLPGLAASPLPTVLTWLAQILVATSLLSLALGLRARLAGR